MNGTCFKAGRVLLDDVSGWPVTSKMPKNVCVHLHTCHILILRFYTGFTANLKKKKKKSGELSGD